MTDIVKILRNQEWCNWHTTATTVDEEDLVFLQDVANQAADEIERLRKRVELLEGYLNGALNVIEGFVHCNTTEARKALGEKE